MNSERVHELQLLAMGLGGPSAMLSARRNSNESGFVKKISREGGGAQKFHHDFLSHLGPCSIKNCRTPLAALTAPRAKGTRPWRSAQGGHLWIDRNRAKDEALDKAIRHFHVHQPSPR